MESSLIELEAQMNVLQAEKEAFHAKLDQVSRRDS
jgi:prefoldin subunit 5